MGISISASIGSGAGNFRQNVRLGDLSRYLRYPIKDGIGVSIPNRSLAHFRQAGDVIIVTLRELNGSWAACGRLIRLLCGRWLATRGTNLMALAAAGRYFVDKWGEYLRLGERDDGDMIAESTYTALLKQHARYRRLTHLEERYGRLLLMCEDEALCIEVDTEARPYRERMLTTSEQLAAQGWFSGWYDRQIFSTRKPSPLRIAV